MGSSRFQKTPILGGGYKFIGWAKTQGATEKDYADKAEITVTENITLYAVWKKEGTEQPDPDTKTFTVTFNANAPKDATASGPMEAQTFTEGTAQALTKNTFTIEGYTFKGWAESQTATEAQYTDGQEITITADTTLYAVWEEKEDPNAPKFTVTFNGNAPEGETVSGEMAEQTFTEGKTQSLTKNTFAVRKGYTFRGWALDKSATVEVYKDEASIKISADTTLYAVWDTGLIIEVMELFGMPLGSSVTGVNEYLSDYVIIPVDADVAADAFVSDSCDIIKTVELQGNNAVLGTFANCKNLETVYLPAGAVKASFLSFRDCPNLKRFEVDPKNPIYKVSDDGRMVLSKKYEGIFYAVLKDDTGGNTFENKKVLWNRYGEGGTTFISCEHLVLKNVKIEPNFTFGQTQGSADTPNTFLKTVVFENVTKADSDDFDPSFMFDKCVALESADLSGCSAIKRLQGTFSNCTSLKKAALPEGMTWMDGTFNGCTSLTEFNIPASVTHLTSDLGEGNGRNVSVTYPKTIEDYKKIRNNDAFGGKVNVTVTCLDGKVIYTADSDEIKVEQNP